MAHYWLHDELYRNCSIQSPTDWSAVQQAIGEREYNRFEWQANSFAGLLLVPTAPLKAGFNAISAKLDAGGVFAKQIDHHPFRARIILELAMQFAVSEKTMEIRLERDGLLAKL